MKLNPREFGNDRERGNMMASWCNHEAMGDKRNQVTEVSWQCCKDVKF